MLAKLDLLILEDLRNPLTVPENLNLYVNQYAHYAEHFMSDLWKVLGLGPRPQ
jgi:hypothetical protein